MSATLKWLQARADNVAVGLLAAMFVAFVLQIVSRYVFDNPIGWTLELCLTTWLWLVFWEGAFLLRDRDHVRFDMFYLAAGRRLRRALAIVGALGILVGLIAAMPATYDYITFYKIKKSATLHIRLDYVFSIYGVFAVALVIRYGLRLIALVRGRDMDELDGPADADGAGK